MSLPWHTCQKGVRRMMGQRRPEGGKAVETLEASKDRATSPHRPHKDFEFSSITGPREGLASTGTLCSPALWPLCGGNSQRGRGQNRGHRTKATEKQTGSSSRSVLEAEPTAADRLFISTWFVMAEVWTCPCRAAGVLCWLCTIEHNRVSLPGQGKGGCTMG